MRSAGGLAIRVVRGVRGSARSRPEKSEKPASLFFEDFLDPVESILEQIRSPVVTTEEDPL